MAHHAMKPHIRLALPEEAPIVLSLWQGSARWLIANGINQWRLEYFSLEQVTAFMKNGSDVYVALRDDQYVGTYTLTWSDPHIWQELDCSDAGYIHRFAVNRAYKGQGIGNDLLRAAEQQIRHKGKTLIRLDCMADNHKLNQYYRDYGFRFVRRVNFEALNWSANLYEKQ